MKWRIKTNLDKGSDHIKRKMLLAMLCILVVSAGVIGYWVINRSGEATEYQYPNTGYLPSGTPTRTLNFSLVGSCEYDPMAHIGPRYELATDNGGLIMDVGGFSIVESYTDWVHIRNGEEMNLVSEAYRISSAYEIDFNQNEWIVSFGREITDMQCYRDNSFPESLEVLLVKYAQPYAGNKVFFYQIPTTKLVLSVLRSSYYVGDEWGIGNSAMFVTGSEHWNQEANGA